MKSISNWLRDQKYSKARKAQTADPPSLPPRKQALTFPLPPQQYGKQQQRTILQMQSPFFALLPLELRLRIYEELLGHHTIHLEFQYDLDAKRWTWWHCVCTHLPGFAFWEDHCRTRETTLGECNKIMTSILFSCRQMYSEAVPILYGSNTFKFREASMARHLPRLLSSRDFHLIKGLEFGWTLGNYSAQPTSSPSAQSSYTALWDTLASMRGLRRLCLIIFTPPCQQSPGKDLDDAWLAPLEKLSHLEQLTLFMPESFVVTFQPRMAESGTLEMLPRLEWSEFVTMWQPRVGQVVRRVVGTREDDRVCVCSG